MPSVLLISLLVTVASVTRAEETTPAELPAQLTALNPPLKKTAFLSFATDAVSGPHVVVNRNMLVYSDALYSNWTEWQNCSKYTCKEYRYRQCLNESYKEPIGDYRKREVCPFKFITEERQCVNRSECIESRKFRAPIMFT
ncbi:unnamed protein product [Dibothriocephalus latus]|uniref:Uncharacterized protein n=1 Tax=Dibothriocephalus latus TaxID=60516 RepID=A0A3P7M8H8_DIBLA|nr:unnamed protein product [Dibothriocephalus latus]